MIKEKEMATHSSGSKELDMINVTPVSFSCVLPNYFSHLN